MWMGMNFMAIRWDGVKADGDGVGMREIFMGMVWGCG